MREREELELLREQLRVQQMELFELRRIRADLENKPKISSIKIKFGGIMPEGPVTLNVGQSTTASVDGFDQFGAAWTGAIPPVTYAVDNAAIASSTPNADGLTDVVAGVAPGVANLTASLTTAEGLALTDTESVTVLAVPSVLSSIKVNFTAPA